MTVRVVVMGAVLLTALLLATVVLPAFAIGGVRPDLVTLTVVGFALADGPDTGLRYGFSAGLATDLLPGSGLVGVSALVLLLIGYLVGLSRPYLTVAPTVGMIVMGGLASALAVAGAGTLSLLFDLSQTTGASVLRAALGTGLYSAVVAPLVCHPLRILSERFSVAATGV